MVSSPRLFVLADSISIAYGPTLERMLLGRFTYDRKGYALLGGETIESSLVNSGDSSSVLAFLHSQVSLLQPGGYLLLNCGLHDIRVDPHTRAHQVELESYAHNLEQILKLAGTAGQQVIWVSTTPVVDARHNRLNPEFLRYDADVMVYNARAAAIMHRAGIPGIDLYSFTCSLSEPAGDLECLYSDHVHFTQPVTRLQAAYIAGWLEAYARA